MALFLSTHVNRIDKKGRVSVPSGFRAALAAQSFQGVVLFKSNNHAALEGCSWSTMEEISRRMDQFDLFSDTQDDLATAIFGAAVQLPFDSEGRILLPADMINFAGLEGGQAAFVGLGTKFQIWDPEYLAARQAEARKNVQMKKLTLPKDVKQSGEGL
jgi:MraZ protein